MDPENYQDYVNNLDDDALVDISRNLDRHKYPDRWEILQRELQERKQREQASQQHPAPKNPTFIGRLWRGEYSFVKTFWLCWFVPSVITPIALTWLPLLLLEGFGTLGGLIAIPLVLVVPVLLIIYQLICFRGIWLSASKYGGLKAWPLLARIVVAIHLVLLPVGLYQGIQNFNTDDTHDPGRSAEMMALPSEEYPLAGFFKENRTDNFGFAIGPHGDGLYYISFCGPGGCFKPGTYRPDSPIIGDSDYEVIDNDTIKLTGLGGFTIRRTHDNKR